MEKSISIHLLPISLFFSFSPGAVLVSSNSQRGSNPFPTLFFFGLKMDSGLKRKMFPHSALERRYSANEKKIGNQPDCPFFLENIKALKI